MDEEALDEKKLTDAEMAKREEIVKSMKKGSKGFKARYGERAKEVMYATATKQAKKLAEENVTFAAVMEEIKKNLGAKKMKDIEEQDAMGSMTGFEPPSAPAAPAAKKPEPEKKPAEPMKDLSGGADIAGGGVTGGSQAPEVAAKKEPDKPAVDVDAVFKKIGQDATADSPKPPTEVDIAKQSIRAPVAAAKGEGQTGKALAASGISKSDRLSQAFVDKTLGAGKFKAGSAEANLALAKGAADMKKVAAGEKIPGSPAAKAAAPAPAATAPKPAAAGSSPSGMAAGKAAERSAPPAPSNMAAGRAAERTTTSPANQAKIDAVRDATTQAQKAGLKGGTAIDAGRIAMGAASGDSSMSGDDGSVKIAPKPAAPAPTPAVRSKVGGGGAGFGLRGGQQMNESFEQFCKGFLGENRK